MLIIDPILIIYMYSTFLKSQMNMGIVGAIGIGGIALWVVRELMGYRNRMEFQHLRQRYQILEGEWSASRKEVNHLREMNMHMQTVLKDQAGAMLESRREIESKLQGICSQTLISAQKTFLTHLQPILSQFQNSTTGQLKEQSSFLTQLVSPLEQYLQDMKQHIHTLEQTRVGAYAGLKEQIGHLAEGQRVLSHETNALMTSFRSPHIRGCWGEMQLRRVVELAGMVPYCDFQEHPTLATEKRHGVRPDMIISLPGNKSIIVDAKAPMTHYLESTSAKTTAEYQAKIKEHARVLATHIKALSDKKYWSYKDQAVELTVLFLPGESFLSAALEADANLLELAAQKNIILATPILCIALLKTIAQGWRQELFSQKTHRIIAMSQELSIRLEKFHGYFLSVGKALKSGQLAYHAALGLFQETIVPTVHQLGSIVPEEKDPGRHQNSRAPDLFAQKFQDEKDGSDLDDLELSQSARDRDILMAQSALHLADDGAAGVSYGQPDQLGGAALCPSDQDLLDMQTESQVTAPCMDPSNGENRPEACVLRDEKEDDLIQEDDYKDGGKEALFGLSLEVPGDHGDGLNNAQSSSSQKTSDQDTHVPMGQGPEKKSDKIGGQKPWIHNGPVSEMPFFKTLSEKDRVGIKINPLR